MFIGKILSEESRVKVKRKRERERERERDRGCKHRHTRGYLMRIYRGF